MRTAALDGGRWAAPGVWSQDGALVLDRRSGEWLRPGSPHALKSSRWWVLLLAATAGLLMLAYFLWPDQKLEDLSLSGARGPDCKRFLLLVDDSGSMHELAEPRDAALDTLLSWMPGNLRSNDEVAVVDFAQGAAVRLSVTRVDHLPTGSGSQAQVVPEGSHTFVRPAIDAAARLSPAAASGDESGCERSVLLLSDGQFADLPAGSDAGRKLLTTYHIHDFHLLVPGSSSVNPPAAWNTAFSDAPAERFRGSDQRQTAIAVANAVAASTGQQLTTSRRG